MKILAAVLLLFALTACGFQPLYGTHSGRKAVAPQLAQVRVGIIPNASGQQLRNLLLDRLPAPAANQNYQLAVEMVEGKIGIAIARDATVTRQQLRTTVRASLLDQRTNKIVWKQEIFTTSGYNVLASQFSTLIGEEDARTRNLTDLSERLVNMMALYFERGETGEARENVTAAPLLPSAVSVLSAEP